MSRLLTVSSAAPDAAYRIMLPHERYQVATRQHPAMLGGTAFVATGWLAAAAVLTPILLPDGKYFVLAVWAIWLVLLVRAVLRVADWAGSFLVVTSARVLFVTGFLGRRVGTIPLATISDMRYERSSYGRIAGYGKFVIEIGGSDRFIYVVNYIPNPEQLYINICGIIFKDDPSNPFTGPAED